MLFSKSLVGLVVATASTASAASITFWTLDNTTRTVYFTPSPGSPAVDSVTVSNQANTTVPLPDTFQGNFYAVCQGEPNVPGMLGEVAFGAWKDINFFDVSAIVNPTDHNNVKQMFAVAEHLDVNALQLPVAEDNYDGAAAEKQQLKMVMSGCEVYPCDNAYWHPNDIQTKSSPSNQLMTTLGHGSTGLSFL